jgi:hypothetical protein
MNVLELLIALEELGVRDIYRNEGQLLLLPDDTHSIRLMAKNNCKTDNLMNRNREAGQKLLTMVSPIPREMMEVVV